MKLKQIVTIGVLTLAACGVMGCQDNAPPAPGEDSSSKIRQGNGPNPGQPNTGGPGNTSAPATK